MKLPRDLSGDDLTKALAVLGYQPTRQRGSHVRLTTQQGGEHHLTVPQHSPLKLGTLAGILATVAAHFNLTRDQLMERLFGTKG
ncbi:MAG TPA: type II toxin-antitoxin system HicA family toxin [Phycisphaerae bacterium]|nr:type II toxin-antitoxin system HicA family toxin [Phycisphaerae bacterium]HRR87381.1 type II toxin-antitoxin system HicA family toxin [Phycisphaerae bacterium]